MTDYEIFYSKIYNWFNKNTKAYAALKILYKLLIVPFILTYIILLLNIFDENNYGFIKINNFLNIIVTHNTETNLLLAKIILMPATIFIVVSILRMALDARRPYEVYDITPLIKKNKKRESMPSRHVLSAALIAMTTLYVNPILGIILLIFTVLVAIIRVIAGVHFPKDVIAGIIIGVVCTYIGFWLM